MSDLPAPLVPPDCDLTDFSFMPLDVRRLRDSRIASIVDGEAFRSAVLLWCAAWHQKPAASLPDDDVELAQLAGFGRVVREWQAVKANALYGWIRCSDGRLYHPVVAEKALESWAKKLDQRWRRECDRIRKENKARESDGRSVLPVPDKPNHLANVPTAALTDVGPFPPEKLAFPSETGGGRTGKVVNSPGNPAENALKGQGQGEKERYMSEPDGSDASVPIGSVSRDLPDEGAPPCAAASPDGPPAPAAPRKRLAYPVEFDALWAAYPTDPNMSKSKALDAWKRLGPDDRRAAMASIPGFRAYCRKNPTYRPVHLVRFITDRRFDGYVSSTASPGSATPAGSVAELTPEQRGNAQRSLVRDWQNSPFGWPYKLGPKPDEPGCQIPPEILAEFGFGPLVTPPRRAASA